MPKKYSGGPTSGADFLSFVGAIEQKHSEKQRAKTAACRCKPRRNSERDGFEAAHDDCENIIDHESLYM
jgi:hypothetical protein